MVEEIPMEGQGEHMQKGVLAVMHGKISLILRKLGKGLTNLANWCIRW